MNIKSIGIWLALTAVMATATYWLAIYQAPRFIMNKALTTLTERYETPYNTIGHSARIDAEQRRVVRPSPDLAYSVCVFDLSSQQRIQITMPKASDYLSVALYDNDTNNFFHLNDSQILSEGATIYLYAPEVGIVTEVADSVDMYSLNAPTQRGLALFRTVVRGPDDWQRIEAERAQLRCSTQ